MAIKEFFDDTDPQETHEWREALNSVVREAGHERAAWLLKRLTEQAQVGGYSYPHLHTPYVNTIPPDKEAPLPGDMFMERRIRSLVRWNALAMVMRANESFHGIGGHIATFASCATLYEIGFNYFFRGATEDFLGDLVYFQGHSSPGVYARAFLEGRLSESQLEHFRRESAGAGIGLSSYPHPHLMPDFWQFPTVSVGLGPMQAIYQAHIMRYLENQELLPNQQRRVWAFLGDGEMDEPESIGALDLAGREGLDNLTFVVNCNLQRLDGPVRGNGKVIQELEGIFRGAGWNVIKVIWGRRWDPLLAKDEQGMLRGRMEEVVDGEYQACKKKGGAYTREHFFGKYPELAAMVADMSDEEIYHLNRGGHDPFKVYAAYHAAVNHKGRPTVILAKTVKGYGTGIGEATNKTHQLKKLDFESLKAFRDRFDIPIKDSELDDVPFYRPADNSPEIRYLQERRRQLGGYLPQRRQKASHPLKAPPLSTFEPFISEGSNDRPISTTMAFVRMLGGLLKDEAIGPRIVPIVPDEARTFGMEGLFRQLAIYSSVGQKYEPEDAGQMMYYREDKKGRILEQGITEAGSIAAWMACATSYSNNDLEMVPFYLYYSMFGYQRVGDFCWASGDIKARGFLLGGTSGRTTLNGEGLQHQDGHNLLMFSAIPNCMSYDPAYAYELAVIVQDGLKRMLEQQQDVFYYLTIMNENYVHAPLPKGAEKGIIKGMYRLRKASGRRKTRRVQLLGSGTILREVEAAAELLETDYDIKADVWSVTSYTELQRDAQRCDHEALLHPGRKAPQSWLSQCLDNQPGPIIAASDYVKTLPNQITPWLKAPFYSLGTDGFGRSDTREALRHFFEVDRYFVALAAIHQLVKQGDLPIKTVKDAIKRYQIDPDKGYPPEE